MCKSTWFGRNQQLPEVWPWSAFLAGYWVNYPFELSLDTVFSLNNVPRASIYMLNYSSNSGKGGLDQLCWAFNCAAFKVHHR
jgi:hypothetical protein